MDERRLKRKSPRPSTASATSAGGSGRRNVTGDGQQPGAQPTQRSKSRRGARDKAKSQPASGVKANPTPTPIIQHSFLTDVSDVQEMEKGLLGLLNDFHSGKLQAFGNECSMAQMEQVREMQEKLARLHFDLYGEADEMPDSQRKEARDGNMDELLNNLEDLSSSIQKLNLADSQQEIPRTTGV